MSLSEKWLEERKQIILCSKDDYKAKVLNWNSTNNVDIVFEDGTIKKGLKWCRLKDGNFRRDDYPQIDYASQREGEIVVNKQGREVKIIKYINARNVEIEFTSDGYKRKNIQYKNFKDGSVIHPDDLKNNRYRKQKNVLGQKRISLDGYVAEVIEYNKSQDFTIMFEDGTRKHLSCWKNFDKGNFVYSRKENFKLSDGEIENRKKIVFINKEGYEMRLHKWRGYEDIDVIFEDGSIEYGRKYEILLKGAIRHPKYGCLPKAKLEKLESLETIKKVISYKNKQDIDVEMADGTIYEHTTLALCFGSLSKKYPFSKLSNDEIEHRLSIIMEHRGRKVHIKEFRSSDDLDLEFEDGIVLKNKTYTQFIKKNFEHPDDITEDSMISKILANYKRGAKDRNLDFNLSRDEVANIIHKPCYLCGRKNINEWKINGSDRIYRYNGIDRVDNNKGYFIGNVKPCCFDCNHAKSKNSLNDFLEWVNLISNNYKKGEIVI